MGALLVGALLGTCVIVTRDDGDRPNTKAAPTTAADATTTEPAAAAPPELPDGTEEELEGAFGDLAGKFLEPDACRPAVSSPFSGTGPSLDDPAITPLLVCATLVEVEETPAAPLPPLAPGNWLLLGMLVEAVADDDLAVQAGLAFDRPGETNRAPADTGLGLSRVAVDIVAFGEEGGGWKLADVFDPDGFTPLDVEAYAHVAGGSRLLAFAFPASMLTPETAAYLQAFARRTAPGAEPSDSDPAGSRRVDLGLLGEFLAERDHSLFGPRR